MLDVLIREAKIEDLKDIQKLSSKLFVFENENCNKDLNLDWSFQKEGEEYFVDSINNKIVYLAIVDDKMIGYLSGDTEINHTWMKIKEAEIVNLYIEEEFRNLGIGTMLIEKFKEYCKDKGISHIILTAFSNNINALKCYENKGFKEYKTTMQCEL